MEILSWLIKSSLTKFLFYIRKNSITCYLLMYFFKVKNQNEPIAIKILLHKVLLMELNQIQKKTSKCFTLPSQVSFLKKLDYYHSGLIISIIFNFFFFQNLNLMYICAVYNGIITDFGLLGDVTGHF